MAKGFIDSFIWGIGRGLGNTASKRTSEYIGSRIINPRSKFRKRIEKFDLGGDFKSARKRIIILLEMFHEEYVINKMNLPMMQIGTYLNHDIITIDNKILFFEKLIVDEENQRQQFNVVISFWNNVKNSVL